MLHPLRKWRRDVAQGAGETHTATAITAVMVTVMGTGTVVGMGTVAAIQTPIALTQAAVP